MSPELFRHRPDSRREWLTAVSNDEHAAHDHPLGPNHSQAYDLPGIHDHDTARRLILCFDGTGNSFSTKVRSSTSPLDHSLMMC